MKKFKLSKTAIAAAAFVILFGILCAVLAPVSEAKGTLWSLFPPVLAIGMALITKEVYSSLFFGILSGALIAADFNFLGTVDTVIHEGFIGDGDPTGAFLANAGIIIFLVLLGSIVTLINMSGGSAAFGRWAQSHIKSRAGAMLATMALGILIFIDDYFNCLTVGAVMRPVTDTHKISRAKLAYLIDSTAAPVCMIAPISSWAAAVSSYAADGQGIKLFCMAIPFNYYSLLTLLFIVGIVLLKVDFGPMKRYEKNAVEEGDLFTDGELNTAAEELPSNPNGKTMDLIIPVVILILCCVFGLLYQGGILDGVGLVDAFSNTDATVGLPWGAILALIFIIIYYLCRRTLTFKDAMKSIPQGLIAMASPIIIVTMATALKNTTTLLDASTFVSEAMSGVGSLQMFLPAIIFLVAIFISSSTGTSWGTFGILIPIVITVFDSSTPLYYVGMSACLAGSVCGDHLSPISDTTIMSSAGAECDHLNHVKTQIPYALTVAGVSFLSFIFAGLLSTVINSYALSAVISFAIAAVLLAITLFVLKLVFGKKKEASKEASSE